MQGRGLGKRLISELEKLCKEYHIEKVMLTVLKCECCTSTVVTTGDEGRMPYSECQSCGSLQIHRVQCLYFAAAKP